MTFPDTKSKLEDTRTILDQLHVVRDTVSFRAVFNSFLNSARAITYALQKEGGDIPGFKEWYTKKQEEMRDDELLRFIHNARTKDFHEGKHQLSFSTHVDSLSSHAFSQRPSKNAIINVGTNGAYWLVDQGTPRERRIPVRKGIKSTTLVSIKNAPTKHQGANLTSNDPITICVLTLDYFSELIHEATSLFNS